MAHERTARGLAVAALVACVAGCASAVEPVAPRDAATAAVDRVDVAARADVVAARDAADVVDVVDAAFVADAAPPSEPTSCIDGLAQDGGGVGDVPLVTARVVGTPAPDPPPGRCDRPIVRALTLPSDSLTFNGRVCEGTPLGVDCEYIFSLHLDVPREITLTAADCSGYRVSIRRNCADASTSPASDWVGGGGCTASEMRTVLAAGDWYFVVQGHHGSDGPGMHFVTADPPPGYFCATPIELTPCTALVPPDSTAGVLPCALGAEEPFNWPMLAYTATIPPGRTLVVSGTHAASTACSDRCTPGSPFSPERFCLTNTSATTTRPVFRLLTSPHGPLATALIDPVPYARCEAAALVSTGTYAGQDTSYGLPAPRRCGMREGRALYYRAVVPPRGALRVTRASYHDSGVAGFVLLDGCGETATCLASSSSWYLNDRDTPRDVVIAAVSEDPMAGAPFALSVDVLAPADAAPNSSCTTASPLAPGVPRTGASLARAFPALPACPGVPAQLSSALYYAIDVPAGRAAHVAASGSFGGVDVTVTVSDGCCSPLALGGDYAVDETTVAIPASSTARHLVVRVDAFDALPTFDIAYTLDAP